MAKVPVTFVQNGYSEVHNNLTTIKKETKAITQSKTKINIDNTDIQKAIKAQESLSKTLVDLQKSYDQLSNKSTSAAKRLKTEINGISNALKNFETAVEWSGKVSKTIQNVVGNQSSIRAINAEVNAQQKKNTALKEQKKLLDDLDRKAKEVGQLTKGILQDKNLNQKGAKDTQAQWDYQVESIKRTATEIKNAKGAAEQYKHMLESMAYELKHTTGKSLFKDAEDGIKNLTKLENKRYEAQKSGKKVMEDYYNSEIEKQKSLISQIEKTASSPERLQALLKENADYIKNLLPEEMQNDFINQVNKTGMLDNAWSKGMTDYVNQLKQAYTTQVKLNQAKIQQNTQDTSYKTLKTDLQEIWNLENRITQLSKDPKRHSSEIQYLKQVVSDKRQVLNYDERIKNLSKEQVAEIEDAAKAQKQLNNQIKAQGEDWERNNKKVSELGDTIKKVFNYILVYRGFQLLSQGIQQAIDTMKDLDKAFTDIQMVTGESDEQTAQLANDYNSLAKEMGSTTQEVAEGASEWLRQGKTAEETTQLLKSSMTLSKVGAIESSEATELLTSSLNGYKLEAQDAMTVVDKISSIDLAAATSSYELATALARTANSADDAGVSFDKLLAMIGTVSSVTRKSASTIGESFKTIFARMGNVAAGKEIDDEGESLNDVETTLNKMGIALRSSQHEWRNFEEVLDEVAVKWKDFNSTEQSQIATAIAGVRQQENFRALMNNWDEVTRLVNVAADSTGSASERMKIYLDSVEAKTNNLKSAWEGFILSLNQSGSYVDFLEMLTNLLEKLQYVDWSEVLKVISAFAGLFVVVKAIGSISTIIEAISGLAAGAASIAGVVSTISGALPILLLIGGAVAGIAVAWKSVKDNTEASIEEINKKKDALEEEETQVKELYKRYSELEGKSKYYELTAEEKQELADITKTLVEQYGFEAKGIDSLTGGYELANDALEKYIENLEREKRLLTEEEEKTLEKEAKSDIKDIKKSKEQKDLYVSNYGDKLINGTDEEKEDIIRQFGALGVYQHRIDMSAGGIGSKEDREGLANAKKILKEKYGYDDADLNTSDPLGTYSLLNNIWKRSGASQQGLNLTDEDIDKILNQINTDVTSKYQEENLKITSKSKEVAEDITKLLTNKLGEDVPSSIADLISTSLTTALSQDGIVDSIDDVDKFIGDYTNSYIQKINANGESLELVLNRYEDLQKKADNGTLTATEYGEYQDALHTYIEMQKEALLATGLTEEKVNELMESFKNDAANNLTIQLLELNEELQNNGEISQETKLKYSQFVSEISSLQGKFKSGEISAKDYFDTLTKKINSIDTSNLDELNKTFGSTENFLKSISVLWGDTQKYLDNIWTTFKGGGDSLEFFNNFDSASHTILSLVDSMQELDKASENIDLTKITTPKEDVEKNVEQKLGIDVETSKVEEAINYINELDGEELEVKIETDGLNDAEDGFDDILRAVEETSDGTLDLQDNTDSLISSLEELESLNLNEVDNAFETLKSGFDNLQGDMTSLVGTTNQEIQNSATYMSQWLYDVANSNKDYAQTAKQAILDITSSTGTLITDISETNVESLAQALMADEKNANTFAAAANSIASQSMQNAVKSLGKVLETMGTAIANLDIAIPIKLKGADTNIKVAGVPIVSLGFDGLESELTIGGEGTKGLSGIGESLANFGKSLQDDSVSSIIANQFTPIQSEYTPSLGSSDKNAGSPSSYSPSDGGSKSGSGSGSDYSAKDAASDLADILEDIEDYEADIELDLEDQTEQLINHYNLEKNKLESLKEELDYYEGIYDSVENTTKWLETQSKLLENQSNMVEELQKSNDKIEKQREKIYRENSGYNVSGWFDSEGNDTLAYGDLINSFEYQKNAIQKETAAQMRDVYNSVAGSTSEDAIENAKDRIEDLQEAADKRLEALDKEREKVENIHDSVSELNDAWDENQEAIRDALADMHDRIIDMRDTLVDQMMEQLEKAVDKQNESIEKDVTRMEQLVSIREKYYDILNETIDTQAELDSELQSSLDSFEYLDEQMRQLMFNEEDYKVLSETLTGIQEDIADIWEDHYAQIDSLTDDEMYKAEYITAETERQLEMKMQEYELAKAELDVAKARTNLQNVQNERNVRMFVNGQWTWVADPDAVKDAQQQLADAEREKNRIEREAEQQRLIDSMDKIIDSDNLQIDENNELLERVQEAIELQTQEVQSIEQALENIANTDLPAVGDVLQGAFGADGKSGWISELLQNINKSTSGLTLALKGYTVASAENALKNGSLSKSEFNDLVSKLGYSFNETTGIVTTPEGSFSAHYKGWTQKNNNDVQLGTANNGVQVTGGGSNANGSGGGSGASGFPRSGHVSTSSLPLRIRSGAGTNYKVLGLMPKGAAVTITGEANSGWAKVQYNGINGYASRQYLTYDQGGVAIGKGMFLKDVNVPERILSPKQTKSFDYLVKNLTTNPVLAALTKNPNVTSNLNGLGEAIGETKQYYFSNFTVQADNLTEFIDSLDAMIPISRK